MNPKDEPTFTMNMAIGMLLKECDKLNPSGFTAFTTVNDELILVSKNPQINERLIELIRAAKGEFA